MDRCELAELLDSFEKTSSHFFSRTDELVNCRKLLTSFKDTFSGGDLIPLPIREENGA